MGFFSDLFGFLFGKKKQPTTPRPPAAPQYRAVAVTTFGQNGKPVAGARVELDDKPAPHVGTTDADGYVVFKEVPVSLKDSHLTILAPGHLYYSHHVDLVPVNHTLRVGDKPQSAHDIVLPSLVASAPWIGQLRREGHAFFDAAGKAVLPVFAHAGELFSVYTRDRERAKQELRDVKAAGFHGIRTWTTLPVDDGSRAGDFWRGRSVNELETPNYWLQMADFLRDIDALGLRVHLAQGDWLSIKDPLAYARNMADVINSVGSPVVALFEGLNEARDTGCPDVRPIIEFMKEFKRYAPQVLCGLSAFTGTEEVDVLNEWSQPPADVVLCHGYRGGRWWDKVRHIFSLQYEGKPALGIVWQGEPCGPGPEVSVTSNQHELEEPTLGPARLSAMALMALITRQAWVYMSGAGVLLNRKLNSENGFSAIAAAAKLLPQDVMTYQTICHGGTSWGHRRVFAAWGEHDHEMRADHAIHNDGRFVCLIYGNGNAREATPVRPVDIDRDEMLSKEVRLVVGRIL